MTELILVDMHAALCLSDLATAADDGSDLAVEQAVERVRGICGLTASTGIAVKHVASRTVFDVTLVLRVPRAKTEMVFQALIPHATSGQLTSIRPRLTGGDRAESQRLGGTIDTAPVR